MSAFFPALGPNFRQLKKNTARRVARLTTRADNKLFEKLEISIYELGSPDSSVKLVVTSGFNIELNV